MYLNKYTSKKKLGKGAYGDVHLVEDENGKEYALKIMSLKKIEEEQCMRQYIEGQIQCMKQLDSPYILKLIESEEDNQNIYLVLEFCQGGDLLQYQSRANKNNNMVFPLDRAAQVLSQVISGLEDLHKAGYLHRDIKAQNVLVTKVDGKEVFKLADFGFSKKSGTVGGTILGTDQFMSPEIFKGDEDHVYGFEVDMWAFGVLFYFMLNAQFPFKLNPYLAPEKKEKKLIQLAQNFSYKASVEKSKKKNIKSCTPEVEELFKQMFNLDPDKRITFFDIRSNDIFAKYFPEESPNSRVLYKKKGKDLKSKDDVLYKSKVYRKDKNKKGAQLAVVQEEKNINMMKKTLSENNTKYPIEYHFLYKKRDSIYFIKDIYNFFLESGQLLRFDLALMISYDLYRYYMILVRQFKEEFNVKSLSKKHPGLEWGKFVDTKECRDLSSQIDQELENIQLKFINLSNQVEPELSNIGKINQHFKNSYNHSGNQAENDKYFWKCFPYSSQIVFKTLKEKTSKDQKSYMASIFLLFSNDFNLFREEKQQEIVFRAYLSERKMQVPNLNYNDLKNWLSKSSEQVLKKTADQMLRVYFGS